MTAANRQSRAANPTQIAQWLRVFAEPGQVVELRVLDVDRKGTISGYYDDFDKLARDAAAWDGKGQIYFTLNPVNPACIARCCNRAKEWAKQTTSDGDIVRRRWLFLDFDPPRPAGVSATDAEKAAAESRAKECQAWLSGLGWPYPVEGDSGNGWHRDYRIDLPNDEAATRLVDSVIKAVSLKFSDGAVSVDETTFNASRICKLYGVLASKGDDTTGKSQQEPRPHRYSRLGRVPDPPAVVSRELLERVAAFLPKPESSTKPRSGLVLKMGSGEFDVPRWVREYNLPVKRDGAWNSGHKWVLNPCPWNEAHTDCSAYIVQLKGGALSAGCHHNGCAGKDWFDLRDLFEPGWRDRQQERQQQAGRQSSETSGAKPKGKSVRPLPPYAPFPVEALPPVMKEYAEAAAEAIGCDVALVALPMLATVAGAIGNSRAVCLKKSWTEPAVVWAGTIAESGGHKSPAYHAAVNPLFELQMDEADEYKAAVEEHKKAKEEWAAKNKEERGDEPKAPPEPPSRVTSDVTIETFGELLRDATRGLLVARDELDGWFQSFTRYKGKGGGNDRANWLELHGAKPLKVDRLTRDRGPLMIRRACASVTGTVQPGTLARALDTDALQAGMGARFLLAMPPRRRRVWTERDIPDELSQQYRDLLKNLLALPLKNETRRDPFVRGLSSLAKDEWIRFYNEWGSAQHAAEGEQAAAMAKLEGYAPRLALVHHVVSHVAAGTDDATSILQGSMQAGITLARWFSSEATRVYAMLHEDEATRQRRRLLEWIAAHGEPIHKGLRLGLRGVTVQALQKSNSRRWPTAEAAEADLAALVTDGVGEWVEDDARPGGGRRKRWFVLTKTASDVSDNCSDERQPGDEPPSDDCSDVCSEGTGDTPADSSATPGVNGTYQQQPGEAAEQLSETSDANSRDSPF
jgi:hypothetical protein